MKVDEFHFLEVGFPFQGFCIHVFKTRACTNRKWAKVLNLEWLNLRASDLHLIAILLSSKKLGRKRKKEKTT